MTPTTDEVLPQVLWYLCPMLHDPRPSMNEEETGNLDNALTLVKMTIKVPRAASLDQSGYCAHTRTARTLSGCAAHDLVSCSAAPSHDIDSPARILQVGVVDQR